MTEESGLPSQLAGSVKRAGLEVLNQGLPALPDVLSHQMTVPVACWKAANCAVVLFLRYSRLDDDGTFYPSVTMGGFSREGDRWAPHPQWTRTGWSHDPLADPGGLRDLDGRAIVGGGASSNPSPRPGFPASVMTGRVSPAVTHLALIQDDREDRRELRSHFGAWVVCIDWWSPYRVNALDETGTVIGSIAGPSSPPMVRRWR